MSKRSVTPGSRLICFGSARAQTNSSIPAQRLEDDFVNEYNP